ncbi:MAG: hypothetical protein WA790_20925 [Sulfitobacter sp.]
MQECLNVEACYISAALALLRDDGVTSVQLIDPHNPDHENRKAPLSELPEELRSCLREQSNLQFQSGTSFIHVGYDYYMYVGLNAVNDRTITQIEESGLFVEPFFSPYFLDEEDQ